ncbi:next to brca1 gene 1 protein [Phtheirospermum japonicum]|uniref:Next to brca1 gene 1 protein n=1 Tax=Phtheirospermum japonicum TaxID=374723 RepID=A0A830B2Y3_9LAMI|nr:next to brca1 gene 1 protein [Phtheirospermum japonicum]
MAASSVVIKVKYEDTLRRFNAQIVGKELNLTMDGLRKKILSLFSFDPDTELMLTYIDEDDDVVTLADDDDLRDVVKQDLDPLRITVKVKAEKNGLNTRASASSTPLISPRVQQPPLQNLNTGVPEILKTLPGPLYETLTKISADLASKASSSDFVQQPLQNLNTGVGQILGKVPEPLRESIEKVSADLATKAKVTAELLSKKQSSGPGMTSELLVQHFSKLGLSLLDQLSQAQPGEGVTPASSTAAAETKDSDTSNVDPATATLKVLSDVRSDNVGLGKPKPEATVDNGVEIKWSGGFKNESSENVNGAHPGNDSLPNSGRVYPQSAVSSHSFGKKEFLVKKILKKVNGNNVGKRAGSSTLSSNVPFLVNNSTCVGASDPLPGGFGKNAGPGPLPGNFNFPGLYSGFGRTYECPFSGLAGDGSAASPLPVSEAGSFRRSNSQNDSGANIFHRGVRCDGCGVHPITGPRFKSKVKVDYDLCSICFEEMGNHSDYIRMDRPAVYRHHMSFKGLHDAQSREGSPTIQQVHRSFKVKPVAAKLDSRFIQDVNIFDGTVMAPITPFTKIWRMRNNGTVVWPQKTQLVWIGGDKLSNELAVDIQIPAAGLMIDEELEVAVDFISPELPGRYISYWRMALPSGQKFGQRVWVLIQVDSSLKEAPHENVRNLNLNLPPVSLTGPEIINVDPQPMVVEGLYGAVKSKKVEEFVEPNTEQELKFPINDSLLVGDGASSSRTVSYPIIDMSDVTQAVPSAPQAVFTPLQPQALPTSAAPVAAAQKSEVEFPGKVEVEEMLLKELEEMGFKEVDLNKQMLRMNEYDLEQAVDDLCGVAEWDPILEELQEMGFHDMATNKMLLKKNNGSIKRVVMDLIAGEKIE